MPSVMSVPEPKLSEQFDQMCVPGCISVPVGVLVELDEEVNDYRSPSASESSDVPQPEILDVLFSFGAQ